MSDLIKINLLSMLTRELNDVEEDITNNQVWQRGSTSQEDFDMFAENLTELKKYRNLLTKLKEQVEEGTINV